MKAVNRMERCTKIENSEAFVAMFSLRILFICTVAALQVHATKPIEVSLAPAHTLKPMRSVSERYISFALDNAFIRNKTRLPPDQTNSTRIDFQDPLLKKMMRMVGGGGTGTGGYIRRVSCMAYCDSGSSAS